LIHRSYRATERSRPRLAATGVCLVALALPVGCSHSAGEAEPPPLANGQPITRPQDNPNLPPQARAAAMQNADAMSGNEKRAAQPGH